MNELIAKLAVSTTASTVISEAVSADTLLTVIIAFACGIITQVGNEVIKFLVAYFKSKTNKLTPKEEDNDNT